MNKIQANRLRKLADHLMYGQLGHKVFDFSKINWISSGQEFDKKGCGTNGCAIGEMPIVFPRIFMFGITNNRSKFVDRIKESGRRRAADIEGFFGLNWVERYHLFHPNSQNPKICRGKKLGLRARKESVANNMYEFLKIKGYEGKL